MKVLSIMTIPRADAEGIPSADEFERVNAFITELRSKGVLVDTGGRSPEMFELIMSRDGTKTTTTDGPFSEAKEVVGGYALMDVKDEAEAIALTDRFLDIVGTGSCHLHEVSATP